MTVDLLQLLDQMVLGKAISLMRFSLCSAQEAQKSCAQVGSPTLSLMEEKTGRTHQSIARSP